MVGLEVVMAGKKILNVKYIKKEKLLDNFFLRGAAGILFVETARKVELAEQVYVVLDFPNENRSFRLVGKVISRRRSFAEAPLPPGVEVEFFLSEKRTVQLCLDHVSGKNIDFTDRDSRRVPCSLPVFLKWDSEYVREYAEDISEGGIFIRTEKVQPVGTKVYCRLKPPGYLIGIGLDGKVAWLQDVGLSKGMGISFVFGNHRQRKKINELVKRLAEDQSIQVKNHLEKLRRLDVLNPFSKR